MSPLSSTAPCLTRRYIANVLDGHQSNYLGSFLKQIVCVNFITKRHLYLILSDRLISLRFRSKTAKAKLSLKPEGDQQANTAPYYNLHEEFSGKYGKTHVFKVKSLEEFYQKVVQHNYPVVVLNFKE
jgi:hypothetical protein